MGTSTSRNGPRPTTPLLPDWPTLPPLPPLPPDPDQEYEEDPDNQTKPDDTVPLEKPPIIPVPPLVQQPANRYRVARSSFKEYVRSRGSDKGSLQKALREYIRTSSGGSTVLSRRMYSSVQTAQNLSDVLNEFRQSGETSILTRLDLAAYTGGSVLDILSALSDVVSPVTGLLDDALARQAYALAVERVVSVGTVDLDNLTVAEINEIVAIFIEESLVCRVINDIGSSLTTEEHDPATCVTIIDDLYQIISGAVHSDIIAELSDTNPQLPDDVNVRMESIYQLALTVLEK